MKPELEVGTPGYYSIGSDTYPVTLVANKGRVWQIRMESFVGDMRSGHNYFGKQVWICSEDPLGRLIDITWSRKNMIFRPKGQDCGSIKFGKWVARQDPGF